VVATVRLSRARESRSRSMSAFCLNRAEADAGVSRRDLGVVPRSTVRTNVQKMPTGRLFRLGVLALLVPVGVLCGHVLTYLLAIPDPVRRAAVLADTGHGWWAPAVLVGAILAVGGVLWVLAGRLSEAGGDPWGRDLAGWLGPRLAAWQLVLFAAIEVAERVLTGHALGDLIRHEIVEHGLLAQVVVALALTMVCWCLALTVDLVCAAIDRPRVPTSARPVRLIRGGVEPPRRHLRVPLRTRAPPLAC
jgi:hypothetical protein